MDLQQLICLKQLFGSFPYFGVENCLYQIVLYTLSREKAPEREGHGEEHYNQNNNKKEEI